MKTFSTNGIGSQQTLSEIESDKMTIYNTMADAEADLANLEEGQIVATKDTGSELSQPVDVVESGNMHAVTSNAVADCLKYSTTETDTGKVWVDGNGVEHKIYRKVLPRTAFRTNTTSNISIGTNISMGWVDLNMSYIDSDWFTSTRTLFTINGMTDIWVNISTNEVIFTSPFDDGSQYSSQSYVTLVVEYTKTTD